MKKEKIKEINKKATTTTKRNPRNFLLSRIEEKIKSLNYWKGKYIKALEEVEIANKILTEIIQNNKATNSQQVNNDIKVEEKIEQVIVNKDNVEIKFDETHPNLIKAVVVDKKTYEEYSNDNPINEETKKPIELQKEEPKKNQETLIKCTGKILSCPQKGIDVSGSAYYWTNFTDNNSISFPIFLWEKPVNLPEKQQYRIQYWNILIEGFSKLSEGATITIEGYNWDKNNQPAFTLIGYNNEE